MGVMSLTREDHVIVLDSLPKGRSDDPRPPHQREPIVQCIGMSTYVLLELVPKEGVELKPNDKVYVGKGKREEIEYVKRRIKYEDLTAPAKGELQFVIESLIVDQEDKFVEFFNGAGPITTRLHQLELLPGIGKKLMWLILDERKREPFKSFSDISERIKIPDPKKALAKRIITELSEEDSPRVKRGKYRLFVGVTRLPKKISE